MTIRYKTGDILEEEAEALVNPVNCEGVMGKGLALQFKKRFPDNFQEYAKECEKREVKVGKMCVFSLKDLVCPHLRFIINFPTKRHWRGRSHMEDIEAGLEDLVAVIRGQNIRSIAIPALGSGFGGLEWEEVRPGIEKALEGIDGVDIVVFKPPAAHEIASSDAA